MDKDTENPYIPDKGKHDGEFSEKSGTIITLRKFHKRRTPECWDGEGAVMYGLQATSIIIWIII